jgi:CBS domain-containing protein
VIHLSVIADAEETILNKCHEGAILVCVLFRKNNYRMTARRESIIYAIPIAVFRPFVANNAAVLNFLLETFATNKPSKRQ